jgi:hypothetical protein
MKNMIAKYITRTVDGSPRRVGLIVAREDYGVIQIGYSLCNKKDVFDKNKAWEIAKTRLILPSVHIPKSIMEDIKAMERRASRYFKDTNYIRAYINRI